MSAVAVSVWLLCWCVSSCAASAAADNKASCPTEPWASLPEEPALPPARGSPSGWAALPLLRFFTPPLVAPGASSSSGAASRAGAEWRAPPCARLASADDASRLGSPPGRTVSLPCCCVLARLGPPSAGPASARGSDRLASTPSAMTGLPCCSAPVARARRTATTPLPLPSAAPGTGAAGEASRDARPGGLPAAAFLRALRLAAAPAPGPVWPASLAGACRPTSVAVAPRLGATASGGLPCL